MTAPRVSRVTGSRRQKGGRTLHAFTLAWAPRALANRRAHWSVISRQAKAAHYAWTLATIGASPHAELRDALGNSGALSSRYQS